MLNWLRGLFSIQQDFENNTDTQSIAAKENLKKVYDVSEPVISFVELVKRDRKRFVVAGIPGKVVGVSGSEVYKAE